MINLVSMFQSLFERLPMGILGKRSLSAFFIRGLGLSLSFVLQVFLARLMGADQFGLFQLCIGWMFLVGIPVIGGYDVLLTKLVPRYVLADQSRSASLYRFAIRASFLRGIFVICVALLFSLLVIERKYWVFAVVTAVLVVIRAQSEIRLALLRALTRTEAGLVPDLLVRPALFAIFCVGGYLAYSLTALEVLIAFCAAQVASLVIVAILAREDVSATPSAPSPSECREWKQTAFFLMLLAGAFLLLSEIDKVMLGFLVDLEQVGYYAAAAKLATLVYFAPNAIATIGGPLISQCFQSSPEDLQRLLRRISVITIALSFPIVVPFLWFPVTVLSIFGPGFEQAAVPLLILSFGFLVDIFFGPAGYFLSMTESHKSGLYLLLAGVLANVLLNLLLVPFLGISGAAIATLLANLLRAVLCHQYALRRYQVDTSWLNLVARP